MGISSLITGALKKVPWGSLAMNYAPELMRRFGSKIATRDAELMGEDEFDAAMQRIREFEALCEEQRQAILLQGEQLQQVNLFCSSLQSRLRTYQWLCAALGVSVIVLGILLAT